MTRRRSEEERARSAADREAARLERERRRAQREGRTPVPVPGGDRVPPPEPPPPVTPPLPPPEPPPPVLHDDEPIGIRKVTVPPVVRDVPAGASRGVPRARRGMRRAGLVAALGLFAATGWFFVALLQPFAGAGEGSLRVRIPEGAGAGEIGDVLSERGIVDSSFFFALRARLSGKRDELRSGVHELKRDMSYGAALNALTTKPPPPKFVKVTIPEGRSRRETVGIVSKAGLEGDYLAASKRSPKLNPRRFRAPRGTSSLEGFLFPSTYELRPGDHARRLVGKQIDAFLHNFASLDLRAPKRRNLTAYDILIIASMIEREALVPRDRRLIAAVIYNRLRHHMPIGIDATIRYRLNNWTTPLRTSELRIDSAYNTRRRQGLPPTPIGNPGLASIKAAIRPARVSYLFYVVKPCGNGAHAFSSTDAKFQRDVDAYNKARAERGGKDPSRC